MEIDKPVAGFSFATSRYQAKAFLENHARKPQVLSKAVEKALVEFYAALTEAGVTGGERQKIISCVNTILRESPQESYWKDYVEKIKTMLKMFATAAILAEKFKKLLEALCPT